MKPPVTAQVPTRTAVGFSPGLARYGLAWAADGSAAARTSAVKSPISTGGPPYGGRGDGRGLRGCGRGDLPPVAVGVAHEERRRRAPCRERPEVRHAERPAGLGQPPVARRDLGRGAELEREAEARREALPRLANRRDDVAAAPWRLQIHRLLVRVVHREAERLGVEPRGRALVAAGERAVGERLGNVPATREALGRQRPVPVRHPHAAGALGALALAQGVLVALDLPTV